VLTGYHRGDRSEKEIIAWGLTIGTGIFVLRCAGKELLKAIGELTAEMIEQVKSLKKKWKAD